LFSNITKHWWIQLSYRVTMKKFHSKQHVDKHLEAEYHQTCRWCICWVCSWEVYSRLDCQSVTLEHTQRHQVLCRSPPDDCPAANADPETIYLWHSVKSQNPYNSSRRDETKATKNPFYYTRQHSSWCVAACFPSVSVDLPDLHGVTSHSDNVHLDVSKGLASTILKRHKRSQIIEPCCMSDICKAYVNSRPNLDTNNLTRLRVEPTSCRLLLSG